MSNPIQPLVTPLILSVVKTSDSKVKITLMHCILSQTLSCQRNRLPLTVNGLLPVVVTSYH